MVKLQHDRTLSVARRGDEEIVEIRAGSGELELRLRLTEDGVVLQLEGARISLKSAGSLDLDCKSFNLNADADVHIAAKGDVHVRGEVVHLN